MKNNESWPAWQSRVCARIGMNVVFTLTCCYNGAYYIVFLYAFVGLGDKFCKHSQLYAIWEDEHLGCEMEQSVSDMVALNGLQHRERIPK